MEKLDKIDLICIDCIDLNRSIRALMSSSRYLQFNSIKLLTSKSAIHNEIEIIEIPHLDSKKKYSDFVLKDLYKYVSSDFVLLVQWDGWVINPFAWNDEFYKYDYIGAPWRWDKVVGNGGFSLRSQKLLRTTKMFNFLEDLNEDHMICRTYRKEFEMYGIHFAPYDIASKFSVELETYNGQFGWHGNWLPLNYHDWFNQTENALWKPV